MPLAAVTYDCWSTLLRDYDEAAARAYRSAALATELGLSDDEAAELLTRAWHEHDRAWRQQMSFGAGRIAEWCLEQSGVRDPVVVARLTKTFEETTHEVGVAAVDGSVETLSALRATGVRTALVCDTGFTPGRVLRRLLDRVGLLDLLEAFAFSDEVGVPKPSPRMFAAALEALGARPDDAVHVGDLRRTDVAGAQAFGMRAARFTGVHDDESDGPTGDWVIASHPELLEHLGIPAFPASGAG